MRHWLEGWTDSLLSYPYSLLWTQSVNGLEEDESEHRDEWLLEGCMIVCGIEGDMEGGA